MKNIPYKKQLDSRGICLNPITKEEPYLNSFPNRSQRTNQLKEMNKKTTNKKLSKKEGKMMRLRNWLYDNYKVFSFSKLKDKSKQEIIDIRQKALAFAGFTPQNM